MALALAHPHQGSFRIAARQISTRWAAICKRYRDAEWALIEPHLPPPAPRGRTRQASLRDVVNAIFYIAQSGNWTLSQMTRTQPQTLQQNPPDDPPRHADLRSYQMKREAEGEGNCNPTYLHASTLVMDTSTPYQPLSGDGRDLLCRGGLSPFRTPPCDPISDCSDFGNVRGVHCKQAFKQLGA